MLSSADDDAPVPYIAMCLAKDPRLRYDTAPELAAALAAAADGTLDDGYAKRARAVLERWPWKLP